MTPAKRRSVYESTSPACRQPAELHLLQTPEIRRSGKRSAVTGGVAWRQGRIETLGVSRRPNYPDSITHSRSNGPVYAVGIGFLPRRHAFTLTRSDWIIKARKSSGMIDTPWTLCREIWEPTRKALQEVLTGDESTEEVGRAVRRIVRQQLGI